MSATTHIQWTDATWNPATGCDKVSAGCKHCYAQREWVRLSANPKTVYFGRDFGDVQAHPQLLKVPLAWRKPRMVFVCSMSDLFHEAIADEFIVEVFYTMQLARQHTFQVLTKRPERACKLLRRMRRPAAEACDNVLTLDGALPRSHGGRARPFLADDWPLPNVWLGTSVENQRAADDRIPLLLHTSAAVHWLSCEPLLGPVDLVGVDYGDGLRVNALIEQDSPEVIVQPRIDWVVAGGESGPAARPMHPAWARSLRDQCAQFDVPFFFKQHGSFSTHTVNEDGAIDPPMPMNLRGLRLWTDELGFVEPPGDVAAANVFKAGAVLALPVGKKEAGRELDGVEHSAWPADRLQPIEE